MEKTSRKHLSLVAMLAWFCSAALAQAKSGLENYNQLNRDNEYQWMPIAHYQSASGLYAELRYNYEDSKTISLYGGRTFTASKSVAFSFTPMIGISAGNFIGLSLAANTELEWKNWYLSSQMQYSLSLSNTAADFYFCWSEAGFSITRNLFTGLAVQFTRQEGANDFQPGFLAGLNFGNVSVPLYVFSPFRSGQYVILGINYEYELKKSKKKGKDLYVLK